MAGLIDQGCEVVLVSSGSIAEGMTRLGWQQRPTALHELQAAAAVGQMGLIQAYESVFKQYDRNTAQVLLTHEDMVNRRRYLNARATLNTLLGLGVLPIVNENDTVTTNEIRLGDNDTLAALVVSLIDADVLVLLTDQEGLFDTDPRNNKDASLLDKANASDPAVLALAGPSGSHLGSGGMGEHLGTMLISDQAPQDARKRWLSNQLRARGTLTIDAGAVKNLHERGSSLLAVGVSDCSGDFSRGELVSCVDQKGVEHARGLINYGANDTRKLLGQPSGRINELLGYQGEPELIHRDNLVVSATKC